MASPLNNLELRLWELAVDHLDFRQVKADIDTAIAQGIWTDAFTDAINAGDIRADDAAQILQTAARELGIPMLDAQAAG